MTIRRSIGTPPGHPTKHVNMTAKQEAVYVAGLTSKKDRLADAWSVLRLERDALLAATDWIGARGVNLSASKLKKYDAYRQALRDIPQNFAAPSKVVMPTLIN